MTDQFVNANKMVPITPPPELVQQWNDQASYYGNTLAVIQAIATQAARWGSDQELEACCEVLRQKGVPAWSMLRSNRRPKPPSLKEQALAVIENSAICDHLTPEHESILRRALEQLND